MTENHKIESYLLQEFYEECYAKNNRVVIVEENGVDQYTKFVYDRVREFYWTVTRWAGLGHWHDGSSSNNRPSADVARVKAETVKKGLRLSIQGDLPAPAASPRILIDVTVTNRDNRGTGIQRVVEKVAEAALKTGLGTPFYIEDGRIKPFHAAVGDMEELEIRDGDVFVWIDGGWNLLAEYEVILEAASRKNCFHVLCIYDFLPVQHPKAFTPQLSRDFAIWLKMMSSMADAVIAVSKTVADEFCEVAASTGLDLKRDVRVGWFRLGADFPCHGETVPSEEAHRLCSSPTPFFLAVGTLEPRKGYSVILTAFEKLWAGGVDVRCVIAGRVGWAARALEERICTHEEYGHRLFWLADASDDDLRCLYGAARSLIAASFAEGFGLPIVEASLQGCHVIASDIPVFREAGQDRITYFNLLDSDHLAERIREALQAGKKILELPVITWDDACGRFFDMIKLNHYQYVDRAAWPRKKSTNETRCELSLIGSMEAAGE